MLTTILLAVVCSTTTNECSNHVQDVWVSNSQQGYISDINQCVVVSQATVAPDGYYILSTECFSES